MDLEAREDDHETRPLLGKLGRRELATVAAKQKAYQSAVDARNFAWRLCVLLPAPQLLFMAMIFVVNRLYYWHGLLVALILASSIACSLWAIQNYKQQPWQQWLGKLMLISTLLGFVVGYVIYYKSMVYFFHYKGAATYTSVVPSQPAETVLDAGIVSFAVGSVVDTSRSVGFQSAADGALICVAPVVDASMKPDTPINLYAFGVNCCGFRGSFHCDDAQKPTARYGMVRPEPGDVLPPLLADMLPGPSEKGLEAAVRLQQASYGMATSSKQMFVQYVNDPLAVQMRFVDTAVLTGLVCSAVYLALLGLSASVILLGADNMRSMLRRLVV